MTKYHETVDSIGIYENMCNSDFEKDLWEGKIPEEVICYIALQELDQNNFYKKPRCETYLRKKELETLKNQSFWTFWSAIGSLLAAFFSFLSTSNGKFLIDLLQKLF